jgi:Helix-turn-helix domain
LGRTALSAREVERVGVLRRVKEGKLKLASAARLLEISYRQAKRLWKRYQGEGVAGVKHRAAGRRSNRAKGEGFRQKVLQLVRDKYSGGIEERFGPTLAAEHLASEDGLEIDGETLRRWMLQSGLWSRDRRRQPYRQRRVRKAHFGELVQLDGSFHRWFEQRGREGCLMNLVDDATGKTLCQLGEQETIWTAARLLRSWIEQYGIPRALYTDWNRVYVRPANEREKREASEPLTQFGRMCAKLGIEIIPARSPQAKGRVERNHGTHQDRLIKKLRRQNICSYEAANQFLAEVYLPEHNRRYSRAAASAEDYHRSTPSARALRAVFCLEQERIVSNDWVIRYAGRTLQIERQGQRNPRARGKVVVQEWEDGKLEIRYQGVKLAWKEFTLPPNWEPPSRAVRLVNRPPAAHPWRQSYHQLQTPSGGTHW